MCEIYISRATQNYKWFSKDATLKGLAWLELINNFYNYLKYIDFGFKI